MKNFISKDLVYFALSALIVGTMFRLVKSYTVENELYALLVIAAVLYFVVMFAVGWFFGIRDRKYLPIYDIGFRYHLTTYLIFFAVAYTWISLGFNSQNENISSIHWAATIWGAFIVIHFGFYLWSHKRTVNGLDKNSLFE